MVIEHPEVRILYKYRMPSQRTLDILKSNQVWYARPETLNDPFDCDLDIAADVTWDRYVGMIRHEGLQLGKSEAEIQAMVSSVTIQLGGVVPGDYRERVHRGTEAVKRLLREQGVLSLSSVCDSIPMWSYYTDNHQGVCIGFERTPDNVLGQSPTTKVTYAESFPELSYYSMVDDPGHMSKAIMTTKSAHWAHEHEWRVLLSRGNTAHDVPGRITQVLFGLRTSDQFKREVLDAIPPREDVLLLQAVKVPGEFRLKFGALNEN